jgi:hypothetical protein
MKAIGFVLGSMLFLAFFTPVSMAQQRTFVSGGGNDNNPCTRTAPCRTFGTAIGQTNAGGEVYVLDTAGYGAFAITKSITINAPQGVIAGISVFSGDGIDINAGANDAVILRGLTLNNQGGQNTTNGILFNTGATLHIENCVVSGFLSFGQRIWHKSAGSLFVKDTTVRGNYAGIFLDGSGHASMEQVRLDGNVFAAVDVFKGIAAIRNSSMSGSIFGVEVDSGNQNVALLDIDTCLITNNGTGIRTASSTRLCLYPTVR